MRTFLMAIAILITGGACAAVPEKNPAADNAAQPSTVDVASPSAASVQASDPAPAGLFVEMRAASHPGFERLVFEFGGDKAPPHRIRAVTEVREDPSDKLIPLQGKRFLVVVFDGATLDTMLWESDPGKARRYTGPKRITPDLPLLKEVAVAGNFEAVLSFGVGLSGQATMDVQELTSPARLVIDLRGQ
jgi:hypothetical protein